MTLIAIALASAALAFAQAGGTEPKPKAADYPVQEQAGKLQIAAEYLVHTLPAKGTSFLVPGYLVVEAAIYLPVYPATAVASGQFRLRVNRKKELFPDTPEMVAMSLKYPDFEGHKGLEPEIQAGPVTLGRTQPAARFPGDRRPDTGRAPTPPSAQAGAGDRPAAQTADEAAVALAFPNGTWARPVSGYLYFRYDGKDKSIKSLELVWQDGEREAVLRLR